MYLPLLRKFKKNIKKYIIIGIILFSFSISFLLIRLNKNTEILERNKIIELCSNIKEDEDGIKKVQQPFFYIAALIYNNENILPQFSQELLDLIQILGRKNTYVSIFENGSQDKTKEMLSLLKEQLEERYIDHTITMETWKRDRREDRIGILARLRNKVLYKLSEFNENEDLVIKVIFLNDIYFRKEDILELIKTRSCKYDMACAMDFYFSFYDTWVTRDLNGESCTGIYPYFRDPQAQNALRRNEPFNVYSCWNGVVVFDGKSIEDILFRKRTANECSASECLLVCRDLWSKNRTDIVLNPNVKVSYEPFWYWAHHTFMPVLNFFFGLFNNPQPSLKYAKIDNLEREVNPHNLDCKPR
ncbi:hypothetical protein M0811_10441 [Anaeramoeba ignava]|uniref:Alpha-1,3-mannosyltransferase CMT1 n=1 Tax=Anaeramoeba ignava TaxID=1746090 RepID=A0A9Q0R8T8_ANAIG|nr:hypothetical protein M0811_10441 [Anaeramoeba ignava]